VYIDENVLFVPGGGNPRKAWQDVVSCFHLILAEVVLCAVGVDWLTEATDCLDADLQDPYSEPVF
jgi:hypothetical protein